MRSEGDAYEENLVRYLRAGSVVLASGSAVYDVLSPTEVVIDGLHVLTDGEWFWYACLPACLPAWVPPQLREDQLVESADPLFPDEQA